MSTSILVEDAPAMRARHAEHGGEVGVIMTMGALHEGHAALVRAMRARMPAGFLVLTDYVNPTQFAAGEDFDRYPRTLDADVALAQAAGADAVYAPSTAEVYGDEPPTASLAAGPRGAILEGASRPGHFDGMLTVVSRFMDLTGCSVAAFGEKDYQQLVLVEAMTTGRPTPVEILRVPTVREADGLAMSSRNRYLSAAEREAASSIPRALGAVSAALSDGIEAALEAGRAALDPRLDLDYLVVRASDLDEPRPGTGRVLIAARAGTTRLIDNVACEIPA